MVAVAGRTPAHSLLGLAALPAVRDRGWELRLPGSVGSPRPVQACPVRRGGVPGRACRKLLWCRLQALLSGSRKGADPPPLSQHRGPGIGALRCVI